MPLCHPKNLQKAAHYAVRLLDCGAGLERCSAASVSAAYCAGYLAFASDPQIVGEKCQDQQEPQHTLLDEAREAAPCAGMK